MAGRRSKLLPVIKAARLEALTLYHEAGVSRRHLKNIVIMFKNVKILEFHDHIWNHHEKCIVISTNMPSIALEIPETAL